MGGHVIRASNAEGTELTVLDLLATAEGPIGSPRVVERLASAGIDLAEATAGRFLRQLDRRGLTTRVAKRGRVLTEAGWVRLRELQLRERLHGHNDELFRAIEATDVDALLDLLYVRRALEPEAARLAALRATPEERALIHGLAHTQMRVVVQGGSAGDAGDTALQFHRVVAEACHNVMLVSVARLVLDTTNDPMAKLLDAIAEQTDTHRAFAHDHDGIAAAIREGDAAGAEREMGDHIDDLIEIVDRYKSSLVLGAGKGVDESAVAPLGGPNGADRRPLGITVNEP